MRKYLQTILDMDGYLVSALNSMNMIKDPTVSMDILNSTLVCPVEKLFGWLKRGDLNPENHKSGKR